MIQRYSLPETTKIWSDENKFRIWLDIEILACEAQNKLGLVPDKSLRIIKKKASFNTENILKIEKKVKHDVIAFLTDVNDKIGIESRYLHLGMTSSDVLDTALSVQLMQAGNIILKRLNNCKKILKTQAIRYKYIPMIGRTHGIHAEPITLGLKFALWYDETNRNIERLKKAISVISVGQISGAVGTYEHISPFVEKYVCKKLGLKTPNITTQILQRDRHAEFMSALAITASCIEKYATEIRHLQRTEVSELEECFTKEQKGSSAMPHKKNPITSEQLSGLARVMRGNLLAALENIPLWHERDISHSSVERIILPDSTILMDYILSKFEDLVKNITVYKENLTANLDKTKGLIFSQTLMLKLIEKKMKREEAYKIVQELAMFCKKKNISFITEVKNNKYIKKFLTPEELEEIFDYKKSNKKVDYIFKRTGI